MIRIDNIEVKKGGNTIIKDIDFKITPGKIMVLLGKNGAGKSTLLEALTGMNPLSSGKILWDGKKFKDLPIKDLALRRAVLAQKLDLNFQLTVKQLVEMGTYVCPDPLPNLKLEHLILSALQEVEMQDFIHRDYHSLSGGEQKRVLLAKCIIQLNCCNWADRNKYLFLDEPTSSLDIEQQYKFTSLVKHFVARRNIGVLAILHDINLAAQFADEIIMMRKGSIIEQGSPEKVLTPTIIQRVYDVNAIVNKHPVWGCPLVTTLPKSTISLTKDRRDPPKKFSI